MSASRDATIITERARLVQDQARYGVDRSAADIRTAGIQPVNAADDDAHGVATGDAVRVTTHRGSAVVAIEVTDAMRRGHVSLPNGPGVSYPAADGRGAVTTGVAPNELTVSEDRDLFAGTPWHKNVLALLERVSA